MNYCCLSLLLLMTVLPFLLAVTDFPQLQHLKPKALPETQAKAAKDLITRVIHERSSEFIIKVDSAIGPKDKDTFVLRSTEDGVSITGTSGVAASMGFYHYLKYFCKGQVTWAGKQADLPVKLPVIETSIRITTNDKFRYYQNVCTVSYSMAFWSWARWEQEIDWMSLHGINLPLAFTGQEAIFQKVFLSFGFTQADLDEHFGGPAFLAWARMGNLQGWGGPLPQSWIDQQVALQHKILERMRSLGMIPVLPAFAGFVPKAIKRVFPHANVSRLRQWGHFDANYSGLYLLDFKDPLFNKIGKAVVQAVIADFGTDHIYNIDTFNEMTPTSNDTAYIASAGKAVFGGLTSADPQAVWLMQGWLFHVAFWQAPQVKAYLTSVPQGRMIVLDLSANRDGLYKRFPNLFGQPYIWCLMENFGGTMEMYGEVQTVNGVPAVARAYPNSTMVGIGLTMEGIDQNEIVFEFMMENSWRPGQWNVTAWATMLADQRYGTISHTMEYAWQLLMRTVFSATDYHSDRNYVFYTSRPTTAQKLYVWFKPEDLFTAWDCFVTSASDLKDRQLFMYDLTDVTRNSLQIISYKFYHNLVTAFKDKDINTIKAASENITEILTDLDKLLASHELFLVGKWIADAKSWGTNVNDTKLLEYNARNQITLWGPRGEIHDYASKQWAGVTADYYIPRWKFFAQWLIQLIENGTAWDEKIFSGHIFSAVEAPWTYSTNPYPAQLIGDTIAIAEALHLKYRPSPQDPFFDEVWKNSRRRISPDIQMYFSDGLSADWGAST